MVFSTSFILSVHSFAVVLPIRIVVNGTKINFPDAQPFIDTNERTQTPAMFIGEAFAAGGMHNAALKEDGTVVAWGLNESGQCDIPSDLSKIKAIAAGDLHTVALREDGTVVAWGQNGKGQCDIPEGLTNVKALSAGIDHTVALKEDGTIVAWGSNDKGQCNIPEGLTNVKKIAAGYYSTVILKENGNIDIWGDGYFEKPNIPLGLTNIKAISVGMSSVVALQDDGVLVGFGSNEFLIPSITFPNTITGFICPDFYKLTGQSPLKEGFKVEVLGTNISAVTNNDGYFKLSNIPLNLDGYTIRLSKSGYLYRDIKNVVIDGFNDSADSPVILWAGDVNEDNSINMADVTELAKEFNTSLADENFKTDYDLNKDNSINLIDIMILAKHFNQTTIDYSMLSF